MDNRHVHCCLFVFVVSLRGKVIQLSDLRTIGSFSIHPEALASSGAAGNDRDILQPAWSQLRRNDCAPSIDQITLAEVTAG
jgi:hypothetical protein